MNKMTEYTIKGILKDYLQPEDMYFKVVTEVDAFELCKRIYNMALEKCQIWSSLKYNAGETGYLTKEFIEEEKL